MYSITDLKADLTGVLKGTNLNQVENLNGIIDRAARKFMGDVDAQETRRIAQLVSPIYSNIYDYGLPSDLKGNRIVDIRPQANRNRSDVFTNVNVKEFMTYKSDGTLDIKWNNNIKTLRIAYDRQNATILNDLDVVTGSNGTWAVGGDANSLVADNLNYVQGGGSLKFNVDGVTGTAFLENSTMSPINLSAFNNEGSLFAYVFIPATMVSSVTSVNLRWGSSTSDYYNLSVSAQQDSTAFQNGWNLLRFPWDQAITVGAPDDTAIDTARLTINYTPGTPYEAIRFDAITVQLGNIFEIEYYSKFLFRDEITGAFQEKVTNDSNLINLDVDSYNIFFNVVAELTNQQINTQPQNFDIGYFANGYREDLARYVRKYPAEILTLSVQYYRFPIKQRTRRRKIIN